MRGGLDSTSLALQMALRMKFKFSQVILALERRPPSENPDKSGESFLGDTVIGASYFLC